MALAWEPDLLSPNLSLTIIINRDCFSTRFHGLCGITVPILQGRKLGLRGLQMANAIQMGPGIV